MNEDSETLTDQRDAIDAETRLSVTYGVTNSRHPDIATQALKDLRIRVKGRIQLSTDGLRAYRVAVDRVFGDNIDYGQVIGTRKIPIVGNPDPRHISTTYIERQNLTTRTTNSRFVRKGNAYSKRMPYLQYTVAIMKCHYNFCRPHMSLPRNITPAMAAGLADQPYDTLWMSDLVEASYPEPASRDIEFERQRRLDRRRSIPYHRIHKTRLCALFNR